MVVGPDGWREEKGGSGCVEETDTLVRIGVGRSTSKVIIGVGSL